MTIAFVDNSLMEPDDTESPLTFAAISDAEDRAILREIHAGRLDRFDLFINRHKHRLVRYLHQRVRNLDSAEDLAQEVFLKILRKPPNENHPGRIITWLFTIARNAANDHLRSNRRRHLRHQQLAGLTSRHPSIDPVTAASLEEDRLRISALLQSLPEDQRDAVTLRVFGELTLNEIADITNAKLPTVKSRLRYGLLKISHILTQEIK